MKLLLILSLILLLLIGLYSCDIDNICTGPLVISSVRQEGTSFGKYKYNLRCDCGKTENDNTIYSDSLWSVGDTLKLVKK
jgi:hypothetical protein